METMSFSLAGEVGKRLEEASRGWDKAAANHEGPENSGPEIPVWVIFRKIHDPEYGARARPRRGIRKISLKWENKSVASQETTPGRGLGQIWPQLQKVLWRFTSLSPSPLLFHVFISSGHSNRAGKTNKATNLWGKGDKNMSSFANNMRACLEIQEN